MFHELSRPYVWAFFLNIFSSILKDSAYQKATNHFQQVSVFNPSSSCSMKAQTPQGTGVKWHPRAAKKSNWATIACNLPKVWAELSTDHRHSSVGWVLSRDVHARGCGRVKRWVLMLLAIWQSREGWIFRWRRNFQIMSLNIRWATIKMDVIFHCTVMCILSSDFFLKRCHVTLGGGGKA